MKKLLLSLCLFSLTYASYSQNSGSFLLGINPAITIEPTYPKGTFDINVLPLVVEVPLFNNFDFRAISLVNYGFRNYGSALMNLGFEIALPYYFIFGKSKPVNPAGFFIAPGYAFSRNVYYHHNCSSVYLEPGYSFSFTDRFSLIIDLQYGRSFFRYNDGSKLTTNHFGVKVVLGWWF